MTPPDSAPATAFPDPATAIRVAVIGAGPAGFYAAGHLLAHDCERFEIDMFERLPTPWGLVRSGVAPDHPKIKSVTRIYERTAAHPRFRFFGNVALGEHVSREDLLAHYHAIVYATGSPADRPLGIPGEDLPGSHAATEFVGWYNGHPDHTDLEVDLVSARRAVVIGNGNVALDVARMLVLTPAELAPTDTADHALDVLARSQVQEVVVLGRRGPAQAAFTNPELRELADLTDAEVIVDPDELERALAVPDPQAAEDATSRRNVELLRAYAATPPTGKPKRIVLRFLLSPVALLAGKDGVGASAGGVSAGADAGSANAGGANAGGANAGGAGTGGGDTGESAGSESVGAGNAGIGSGHLSAVELVHNRLVPTEDGRLRAEPTDERETIEAGLVFRAIGYRGVPLPGVPFDERAATILNRGGRVLDPDSPSSPLPGEYVVGWIKRGPSGVIGTNKKDAQETVDAMFADLLGEAAAARGETGAQADGGAGAKADGEAGAKADGEAPDSPSDASTDNIPANTHTPTDPDPEAIEELLRERQPDLITYEGWESIDRHERSLGEPAGRPRVKLTRIEELLRAAASEQPVP